MYAYVVSLNLDRQFHPRHCLVEDVNPSDSSRGRDFVTCCGSRWVNIVRAWQARNFCVSDQCRLTRRLICGRKRRFSAPCRHGWIRQLAGSYVNAGLHKHQSYHQTAMLPSKATPFPLFIIIPFLPSHTFTGACFVLHTHTP